MEGAGLAKIDQVPDRLWSVVPMYTNGRQRATVGVPLWKNPMRLRVLRSPEQASAV